MIRRNKMQKAILASAAAFALLITVPVLAQHEQHGEQGGNRGPNGSRQGDGQRGSQGGNNGMMRGGSPPQNQTASRQNAAPMQQQNTSIGGQRGGDHRDMGQPGGGRQVHGGPFRGGGNTPFDIFGAGGRGFHDNTHVGHHDSDGYDSFRRVERAPRHFHFGEYRRPQGWYNHRWIGGEILPPLFFAQEYWIDNYSYFGLQFPPPGTVWIRDGNDALLIDRRTGEVIQVVYGVFY
jgi:Ni/Co efflux regulator RcnB